MIYEAPKSQKESGRMYSIDAVFCFPARVSCVSMQVLENHNEF